MSSAFFRRPTDDSSSSNSDTDDPEDAEQSSQRTEELVEEKGEADTTESLLRELSIAREDGHDASPTSLTSVDQHRTNLLNALLEDFARSRACEMMNQAKPGSRFNRTSAEIQPLARGIYQQMTQSLAHTGLLPRSGINDSQSNEQTRATYLAGLESLAIGNVHTNDLSSGRPRSQLPALDQQLAVTRVGKPGGSPFADFLQQPLADLSLHQARNPFGSPYSDMILDVPTPRRSHYESSFEQLRLLGKGGFGRVYHAFNLFDRKEYAVKKIPLSPRLSQRYRESGHKELENVLREVQALAQLEHNNVVRYHATWIEEPKAMPDVIHQTRNQGLIVHGRKLIVDSPTSPGFTVAQSTELPQMPEYSDGIVFGTDSVSGGAVYEIESEADPIEPVNQSEDETTSARPSEIFTDGFARANNLQDTILDDSVYVLHVQMSVYPMTLAQYFAPASLNARSAPGNPQRKHCFHLVPALQLLMGILCGLQYIHAKGLIHRDIKPSNIFLSSLGASTDGMVSEGYFDVGSCVGCPDSEPYFVNPRIGDFGLVAELARDDRLDSNNIVGGRGTKAVGTEYYRPPPWTDPKGKSRHEPAMDEKLDVFALGVILVELLWPCATSTERLHVLRDLQKGKVPSGLSSLIDAEGHERGMGNLAVQAILGMVERDPSQRWGCAAVKEWVGMMLTRCEIKSQREEDVADQSAFQETVKKVKTLDNAEGEPQDGPGS